MRKKSFSCIYKIKSLLTGKYYIGSAIDFEKRKRHHIWHLRRGSHCNKLLQYHFNKYGELDFSFSVIEKTEPELLLIREQYFLDTLTPVFNICLTAGNSSGRLCSQETKDKIRQKHLGRKATPAAIEANRKGQIGRKQSAETIEKVRAKNIGSKRSAQASVNMSIAQKKHAAENPKSLEYKEKMSQALKGRVFSEEHKIKIGKAHKGRIWSDEHKANLSQSKKGRHMGCDNYISKPVLCLNNNKIYSCGNEAARELNIGANMITRVCRGERMHTHNLKFIYAENA